MDDRTATDQRMSPSPLSVPILIAGSILVIGMAMMFLRYSNLSGLAQSFLDPALLTMTLFPILYFVHLPAIRTDRLRVAMDTRERNGNPATSAWADILALDF